MSWSKGTLTYGYEVRIDLTDIVDSIIEKLIGENIDWDYDDMEIVIRQSVKTGYRAWNCRATMESPAEHEVELDTDVEEFDMDIVVHDVLRNLELNKIHTKLEVDDEECWDSDDCDEPDPDRLYDEWKDRGLYE